MFNMKIKSALLVVGYFLVLWGSGSSQVVPDGLVYTELEKTLVQGSRGVLTCRFYGDPIAVFWKRGPNPDDSSLMLLWHEGTVSGPKYDDGTYDIDGNSYSLIIKNVSKADTRRFYCRVSNYKGILIRNYTDVIVVDSALQTKSHHTLHLRPKLPGIIQCTVHIRPRTVTWTKKRLASSSNETLVTFENNGTFISRRGAGYDQETFNITKDYSLIINDVQVQSEALYVCEVTDFDTGIVFNAGTLVNVAAQPLEPFPSILECLKDSSDPGYCSLLVNAETTLTCEVREYYPDINLQFFHGSEAVEKLLNTSEINNTDGTKRKSIEIAARESKELYTCVAFNIPGTLGNVSTSVLLHGHDGDEKFKTTVLVIISKYTSVKLAEKNEGESEIHSKDNYVNDICNQVSVLSMNHCKKLLGVIAPGDEDRLVNIHLENKTTFFDIQRMCNEWRDELQRTDCTKIHHVRQDDIRIMEMTDYAWPTDVEIKWISGHFNQSSLEMFLNNLKLDCSSIDGPPKEKGLERLRKWRDEQAATNIMEKHDKLLSALKSSHLGGLLPPRRGNLMYKVELVDVAFELLLQDLLPLTHTLGISEAKLVSYRRPYHQSYLTEPNGTIRLLLEVLDKPSARGSERDNFCTVIEGLRYRNVAINRMIGYEMSYGELSAISTDVIKVFKRPSGVDKKFATNCDDGTSTHSAPLTGNDTVEEHQCSNISPGNRLLKDILHLTAEDIAYGLGHMASPEMITDYELLKVWKEIPRLELFNYRAALAQGLRDVKLEIMANEVVSGKYINGQTSLHFIQNLVQEMDESQLKTLGKLLELEEHDGEIKVWWKSHGCQLIVEWIANWTKEMKGFKLTDPAKRHRDFNDKLVEHGFLELARETMILEQQIY